MIKYRNNGAVGAILDEYEKAITELQEVVSDLSNSELTETVDPITSSEDCRSIQTILSHVVQAGYAYAIVIRNHNGESIDKSIPILLDSSEKYIKALGEMFVYNVRLFDDYPDLKMEEYSNEKKINVGWGQQYDVEQLFEHAIVHVLRHRRQIQRFILKIPK